MAGLLPGGVLASLQPVNIATASSREQVAGFHSGRLAMGLKKANRAEARFVGYNFRSPTCTAAGAFVLRNFRRSRSFFFLFATGNNRGNDGQHGDDSDQFLPYARQHPGSTGGSQAFFLGRGEG